MTQGKDTVVRLAALDGVWEVGGVDRKRGIAVELERASADEWGPQEASFNLRRDPRAVWPDLGPFTPIEIEVGGVKVWAGFINDTPSTWGAARAINAKCLGWQFHLDDDQYERVYVHNRLSDWKDARSSLSATLTTLLAVPQVQAGAGMISIVFPQGQAAAGRGAVVLDAGPGQTFARIVAAWSITAGAANRAWGIGSSDINDGGALPDSTTIYSAVGASSGTAAWTLPTPRRFVFIWHDSNSHTPGADEALKITAAQAFADTAYESGGASILTSPMLIRDALDRGTVLLSSDRSQIDPGGLATFGLPSFGPGEPQTTREVWAAANGLYDNISQIDVERRPVFKPKPTSPIFEVGEFSPFEFGDGGSSGSEIYNRVIVTGQTPDGAPMRVERTAAQQTGAPMRGLSTPAPDNPSATVDALTWTDPSGGTVSRDTVAFDSSPASIKTTGTKLTETFSGTFKAGLTYQLTFRMKVDVSLPLAFVFFGLAGTDSAVVQQTSLSATFLPVTISWTPTADRVGVTLQIVSLAAGLNVDTLALSQAVPTLVDRRQFRRTKRLPISIPLPADGALGRQIADTWLGGHKLVPFKGETTVVGDQAVRGILTGDTVPLERLLLATQQLLRFNDRIDPDTGGQGRDGRMTKVDVDFVKSEAKLTIDNTRTGFEALLNRLAAVITG